MNHGDRFLSKADCASGRSCFVNKPSLDFRAYHALLFLVVIWFMRILGRRGALFPHRATLRRIDRLIESLDSSRNEVRRKGDIGPARYLRNLFRDEVETQVSSEALDPRSVELAFMNMLTDIQQERVGIGALALRLPVPEVTFIFDEVDKISGIVPGRAAPKEDLHVLDKERERSYALQRLLSDMKRVISSAPARFIFVGNRLLHDEWMADRSRRQPLLTSIFDAEIYIPSFMVDHSSEHRIELDAPDGEQQDRMDRFRKMRLSRRTYEYLGRSHRAALSQFAIFVRGRLSPFMQLPFVLPHSDADLGKPRYGQDTFSFRTCPERA